MAVQNHADTFYKDYLNCDYSELEEMVLKAKDKSEREFYARLCDFYLAQNQKRVMQEKPF